MAILKSFTYHSREQGFTLLELLITVAVAGVMAAIALPNMSVFLQNNSRATRMNSLTAAFNYARNEAVSKQTITSVCASTTTPTPANYTCNGTNDFENGWIIFTDANVMGVVDGADLVLRITDPGMAGSATLAGRTTAGAEVSAVSFSTAGQIAGGMSLGGVPIAVANFTGVRFTYCDSRVIVPGVPAVGATTMRAIIMTRTGHSKTSRDGADAGDVHEVRGVNITSCL